MLNGMVLVCADCGNVELEINYIGEDTKKVKFYCPKCENVGYMQGFTAGPIMLGADEVTEIKDSAEKPNWKKPKRRAESEPPCRFLPSIVYSVNHPLQVASI